MIFLLLMVLFVILAVKAVDWEWPIMIIWFLVNAIWSWLPLLAIKYWWWPLNYFT